MNKVEKTVVADDELQIEAYRLKGVVQPFPNHFHEHYVFGLIEEGERCLFCRKSEYVVKAGDIMIFQPEDNHACTKNMETCFDYRGLNITKDVMIQLAEEVTGKRVLPGFSENVIVDEEAAGYMRAFHDMIMKGSKEFEKEENLLLFLSVLIQKYGQPFETNLPECGSEIEKACAFMEEHYKERILLEEICEWASLSKSTLLRAFTKTKGVTPYRYLVNIRINKAKQLLAQGVMPIDAALQTGFSDQSHFTNYFSSFIGLSPAVYRDIFIKKEQAGTIK